jgi:hypothetical protein
LRSRPTSVIFSDTFTMQSQLDFLLDFPILTDESALLDCPPFNWDMPTLPQLTQDFDGSDDYIFGSFIEHVDFMKPKQMVPSQLTPIPFSPITTTLLTKKRKPDITAKVDPKKVKTSPQRSGNIMKYLCQP